MVASSPTEPSRRRGKFRELVNTCHGMLMRAGLEVSLGELDGLLAEHVRVTAAQAGVSEQTALRSHVDPAWARSTAERLIVDAARGRQLDVPGDGGQAEPAPRDDARGPESAPGSSGGVLDTVAALSVLAALGQAQLYAVVNDAARPRAVQAAPEVPPRRLPRAAAGVAGFDAAAAAEVTTLLATAVADDPAAGSVWVPLEALRAALRTLVVFVAHLDDSGWLLCRCCPAEEQTEGIAELRARVAVDAAHLEHAVQQALARTPGYDSAARPALATVLPLRRSKHRRRTPSP